MNESESFAPPIPTSSVVPVPAQTANVPALASQQSSPAPFQHPVGTYSTVMSSPGGYGQLVTDRRDPSAAVVVIAWVVTLLTFGYMLPWAVAASRGKSNQAAIGVVTFFLGWTFVGWVIALVMACQAHQVVGNATATATVIVSNAAPGQYVATAGPAAGWFAAPDGGGRQYWDGVRWTEHRAP
jgi:hypothetical protein